MAFVLLPSCRLSNFRSLSKLLCKTDAEKAQNNIQTGLNQLDDVVGKRTRAIQRKLKGVEVLEEHKGENFVEISEVIESGEE